MRSVRERTPGRWVLARSKDALRLLDVGPEGTAIRDARSDEILVDLATLGVSYRPRDVYPPLTAWFTDDGDRCVIGAGDALWLAEGLASAPSLRRVPSEAIVRDFELCADGRSIACSSWETVQLVDFETGTVTGSVPKELFDVPGHDYRFALCGPLPGQLAVVHGARLLVLDRETLAARKIFVEHGGAIQAAAWSPDGTRIATGSADQFVGVFDPEHGLTASLACSGPVVSVGWSGDSRQLAAVYADGRMTLWDATSGYGSSGTPTESGAGDAGGSRDAER